MPIQPCQLSGVSGYKWGEQGKCYTGSDAKAKALRQGKAIEANNIFVHNAFKVKYNPNHTDPSRTGMLRKKFGSKIRQNFLKFKKSLTNLMIVEDAFGLKGLVRNQRFAFKSTPEQVALFEAWLQTELGDIFTNEKDKYWEQFVREGYEKGAGRAFSDVNKEKRALYGANDQMPFFDGTKEQFLREAFGQAESIEKVQLLASRTLTDLKGVNGAMATRMSRILTEGLSQGQGPISIAKTMAEGLDIDHNRAQTIARTEIMRAHAEGQLDAMQSMGVEAVGAMVEWSTAGDDRVCPLCQPLEGVTLKLKEARGMLPRHPSCLPGDCLVTASSGISAASKRWFDGDFVVIKTASGRELTCTPNHPILTNRGWVAAQCIDTSCKVVCDGRSEWETVSNGNHKNVPTPIHKITESFFGSSQVSTMPVPLTTEDFHGDGMDSQIAIIGSNSLLASGANTPFMQSTLDQEFIRRDSELPCLSGVGSENLFSNTNVPTSGGFMGGTDLIDSLCLSHSSPLDSFRLGLGSHSNPSLQKSIGDESTRDTQLFRQLIAGNACKVFVDDVVHVNTYSMACHVYNLETEEGWYTANGIITHNCRCVWLPAQVGEKDPSTKKSQEKIQKSIDQSIDRERKKGSLAEKKAKSSWVGTDKTISKARPKSILDRRGVPSRKLTPKKVVPKPGRVVTPKRTPEKKTARLRPTSITPRRGRVVTPKVPIPKVAAKPKSITPTQPRAKTLKPKKVKYTPAKTIEEAEQWAKDNGFNVTWSHPQAVKDKWDITVDHINEAQEAMLNLRTKFPGVKVNEIATMYHDDLTRWEIGFQNNMIEDKANYKGKRWRKSDAEKRVKKLMVDRPTPEQGMQGEFSIFTGGEWDASTKKIRLNHKRVVIGDRAKDEADRVNTFARLEAGKKGGYLANIGDSYGSIIEHEFGHALQTQYKLVEADRVGRRTKVNKRIEDFFNSLTEKEIKEGLSSYAAENVSEFMSEAFVEGLRSDARPLGKKVYNMMLEEAGL